MAGESTVLKRWIRSLAAALSVLGFWTLLSAGPVAASETGTDTFLFALVPERNIFEQEQKYKILCNYLGDRLSMRVDFKVFKSYEDVMEQMVEGKAQGGVLGSFLAAHTMARHGMIPLVRPQWLSGRSHYSSRLFKGAGLDLTRDVTSWKGKSVALVNRHTSAGYFFPLAVLRENGVTDPEGFFSRMIFTGSHDATVWMVARGLADLGVAKDSIFEEILRKRPELRDKVEVLYSGGNFPDATFMAGTWVPPALRENIANAFLDMDSTSEGRSVLSRFGATRFVPSPPGDYSDVQRVVREAGFDIRDMWTEGQ